MGVGHALTRDVGIVVYVGFKSRHLSVPLVGSCMRDVL
jgi:hypothetical protein